MDQPRSNVHIDLRPDAHEALYDHDWAVSILDSTRNTVLEQHVFSLCELWKSTSNAFRMPYFLLLTLNSFHDGVFKEYSPPGLQVVQALMFNLQNDPILGLRGMQVQNLTKRLEALSADVSNVLRNNPPQFDHDAAWKSFSQSTEFALGIAGLREMSHNNLLFAHEHYCRSCLEALPTPASSTSTKTNLSFIERFIDRFGKDIYERVYDARIRLAHEVRHAFVHNGGRVDAKLKNAGINQALGDKVHISIDGLRSLSTALRNSVNLVTDQSLTILKDSVQQHNGGSEE
jgi:hypothetical protein